MRRNMKVIEIFDTVHRDLKVLAAGRDRPLKVVGSLLLKQAMELVESGQIELPANEETEEERLARLG